MKTANISVEIYPGLIVEKSGGKFSFDVPIIDSEGRVCSRQELINAACDRACHQLYGNSAFWLPDSDLSGFGQIIRRGKTGDTELIPTGGGRLTVNINTLPSDYEELLTARHT